MSCRFIDSFFNELDSNMLNISTNCVDKEAYDDWEEDQKLDDMFSRCEGFGKPYHYPKLDSEKNIVSICFIGQYISYNDYQALVNATDGHLVVITRDTIEKPNGYHKIATLFLLNGEKIHNLKFKTSKGVISLSYVHGSPMYRAVLKISFDPYEA